jgi:hypothetical protein
MHEQILEYVLEPRQEVRGAPSEPTWRESAASARSAPATSAAVALPAAATIASSAADIVWQPRRRRSSSLGASRGVAAGVATRSGSLAPPADDCAAVAAKAAGALACGPASGVPLSVVAVAKRRDNCTSPRRVSIQPCYASMPFNGGRRHKRHRQYSPQAHRGSEPRTSAHKCVQLR